MLVDFRTLAPGDQATWATALLAALAFLAAVWAARTSARLLAVEQRREDRAEKLEVERLSTARRAHQADLVAAWHGQEQVNRVSVGIDLMPIESTYGHRRVVFDNGSHLPVFSVVIRLLDPDTAEPVGSTERNMLPPERVFVAYTDFGWEAEDTEDQDEDGYTLDVEIFGIEIEFDDTSGRRWRRNRYGRLEDLGSIDYGTLNAALPPLHMQMSGRTTQPDST